MFLFFVGCVLWNVMFCKIFCSFWVVFYKMQWNVVVPDMVFWKMLCEISFVKFCVMGKVGIDIYEVNVNNKIKRKHSQNNVWYSKVLLIIYCKQNKSKRGILSSLPLSESFYLQQCSNNVSLFLLLKPRQA